MHRTIHQHADETTQKSYRSRSQRSSTDNGTSTSNHCVKSSRDDIKKATNSSSNNSKIHNVNNKHNTIENNNKRLSFYNDDSDASDADQDVQRPNSSKWSSKLSSKDSTNGNQKESITVQGSLRSKVLELESDPEDASSTSSCSCEDHSSAADLTDEIHEDLDYDEDSITNSPPRPSNASTTQEEQKDSSASSSEINAKLEQPIFNDSDIQLKICNNDCEMAVDGESQTIIGNSASSERIKSVINTDLNSEQETNDSGNEEDKVISKVKSHKSYDCLLKYFFKDTCYFQIKSINHENVQLSKSMGVWSTPVQNETRLNIAFREHRNVILIFSVQQSGGFQGFARMTSESHPTSKTIPWVLPERFSNNSLGGVLKVDWLCTKELPFHETQDLYNPFNGNKPIKIARDGQQVEPTIGKRLCMMFPPDDKEKLISSVALLKRQTSQRKKSSYKRDSFYPLPERLDYIDERYHQNYASFHGLNSFCDPNINSRDFINHNIRMQNFRPIGRRRFMDHGIYHRQYPRPDSHIGPHHMNNRDIEILPRYPMFYGPNDFHHFQNFSSPPSHPHNVLRPDLDTGGRFHPYQRPRR